MIAVHHIKVKPMSNVLNDSESLWIEINLHKKSCIIGLIYWHPGYDISAFTENVKFFTISVIKSYNLSYVGTSTCTYCNRLQYYVNAYKSYNCSELITKPTRITPSSSTLIDHIYTTLPLDKVTFGILINDFSDHHPIFVSIKSAMFKK